MSWTFVPRLKKKMHEGLPALSCLQEWSNIRSLRSWQLTIKIKPVFLVLQTPQDFLTTLGQTKNIMHPFTAVIGAEASFYFVYFNSFLKI